MNSQTIMVHLIIEFTGRQFYVSSPEHADIKCSGHGELEYCLSEFGAQLEHKLEKG